MTFQRNLRFKQDNHSSIFRFISIRNHLHFVEILQLKYLERTSTFELEAKSFTLVMRAKWKTYKTHKQLKMHSNLNELNIRNGKHFLRLKRAPFAL